MQSEPKLWVDLEQTTIDSTLAGIPWFPIPNCLAAVTLHPTVGETFREAKHIFKTIPNLSPELSPLTPILGSYTFLQHRKDLKFQTIRRWNVFRRIHFAANNKLLASHEIETRFQNELDFLRRAQLNAHFDHCLRSPYASSLRLSRFAWMDLPDSLSLNEPSRDV